MTALLAGAAPGERSDRLAGAAPGERSDRLAGAAPGERSDRLEPTGLQLPGRDLNLGELADLVRAIAADPDSWRHLVAFDSEDRVYVSLHRDSHVDIWLLCWTPENDTGWHDHDVSAGAVAVVEGELVESNLTLLHGARETRYAAGEVFSFAPDHIHRLNGAVHGSVSVHAYSPPLWRMASTPSTTPASCAGSRSRTPTS